MSSKKRVLAVCGSTRSQSVNHLILNTIVDLYRENLEFNIYQGITDLPHFNPDVGDATVSSEVITFRSLIEDADAVLICTPEYIFSLPGSLKNALEWTVSTTIFSDKPAAIIVASGLGEKTFESLSLIMKTLGASMTDDTQLLIQGARAKVNKENNSFDPATTALLHQVMNGLIKIIDDRAHPPDHSSSG